MSGRIITLTPGRYTLAVSAGDGPAGIQRSDGAVQVGIDGGRIDFIVGQDERAYYWWRGPMERSGVRLLGISDGPRADDAGNVTCTKGSARRHRKGREACPARIMDRA